VLNIDALFSPKKIFFKFWFEFDLKCVIFRTKVELDFLDFRNRKVSIAY